MSCQRIGNALVTFGGPIRCIKIGTKSHYFEDHRYCGPIPTDEKGDPKYLSNRHPFWKAVTFWYNQKKRVNKDGFCVWKQAK